MRRDRHLDQTIRGAASLTVRAGLLLLAAAGAAACVDLDATEPAFTLWEAELRPEVSYPDFSGQAAAISDRDGTSVGMAIEGAAPGAQHAWGVRLGSCATPGQQLGSDTDYPELQAGAAGSDTVETRLGARLAPSNTYHVGVRLSAADTARVACGDLIAR